VSLDDFFPPESATDFPNFLLTLISESLPGINSALQNSESLAQPLLKQIDIKSNKGGKEG